jgi:hypothetical protein
VSYTTPQLDAAEAVAALLTGRTIAGFNIVAELKFVPKYETADLRELRVDCIPATPFARRRIDRGAVEQECPVNVGVQLLCEPEDHELLYRLRALCEGIADAVEGSRLDVFGLPTDEIEVEESPERLEGGEYRAVVPVMYRVVTETE